MKICSCFNSMYIKLLVLALVAVALFSYYYFFFLYNREYDQLAEINKQPPEVRPYKFFYFVQTWPGSFKPQPRGVRADFTIHGLWPQKGWPAECCDPTNPFDINQIDTIKSELESEWQALNQKNYPKNEDFWKHEWEKHGTCSLEILTTQLQYFKKSLELKRRTNILQTLKDAGITPDENKKYSLTDIRQSLRKDGYAPRIVCNTKGSDVRIYEIRYCVNRKGSSFILCSGEDIKCASQVKFPPYTTTNDMNYSLKDESPLQQMVHYYNETLE